MKTRTIRWTIFKYNIIVILVMILLITIVFNFSVKIYLKKNIVMELNKIAANTEYTALQQGGDFFSNSDAVPTPNIHENSDMFRYYFMLDRSLKETLTVVNADYILLDGNKNIINSFPEKSYKLSSELTSEISKKLDLSRGSFNKESLDFKINDTEYVAVIRQVSDKNTFGLGYVIIYSNLQKVNQLQWMINIILLTIVTFAAFISAVFSSIAARKVSAPFSSLNQYIRAITERNFKPKIRMQVDDELQSFVNNINIMSEKLESYDKAQKIFFQNISHEFRTPLMSIQSYAEGVKYEVIEAKEASEIIIEESKRMTQLVEDLLYLSRLDNIIEHYDNEKLSLEELLNSSIQRVNGIAIKNNIRIELYGLANDITLFGDEEKLIHAITNIISNCVRYANSKIDIEVEAIDSKTVKIMIRDDGGGFDIKELPYIFERFYKGKKGNFGLGLAISKNIIEKHNGKLSAENTPTGAKFVIEFLLL